ncbi:pantothenate synthetase [Flavobacterium noncentrifugens]|uniref:Pantothenate synthetase n=1 Tax=Flavobacterium noncentrifugens TaxID=1128970 RepID=A0A1G8TGW8_9FLAO|nr:pantoate--beta-alanine ligase [Flavobacterium noncentrifugens]GEP50222.1 pantothenate synthetase [Flavobacterium noncentrifugens]SDJ40664.1 pantoate--beta-alanine ligase [Flavobacterium noncentrifugens]
MLIFSRQADLSAHLKSVSTPNSTIGFVPTMGALHAGHLSLLEESLKNNDFTVISIFVNPTQFNNPEDLEKYPRTLDADVEKIEKLNSDIIVFAPGVADIYEGETVSTHFDYDGLENQMEGKFRTGHFDGVGTIVKRLFEIVKPTNAYFGEKDFQQLQIVKKMVEKHHLPVNVIGCPIFREANGLAMSSRNERLTPEERTNAAVIYKTLKEAKTRFGTESAKQVADWVYSTFEILPGFDLEYFEIADEATLLPFEHKTEGHKYRAFIAVFVNKIRLIDTISLN